MSGLNVNGQFVPEETYFDGEKYIYDTLFDWKNTNALIECPCQKYGSKVKMHVRWTKLKKLAIATNPFQSNNHTPSCPRYGIEERATVQTKYKKAVEYEGQKMIVHLQLFHERKTSAPTIGNGQGQEEGSTPKFSRTNPDDFSIRTVTQKYSFEDFIYSWYRGAIKELHQQRTKRTASSVLFFMLRLMLEHRIWIDTVDLLFRGYIPNASFKTPKYQKVVVGWVKEEEVIDNVGKRWIIEGVGKNTTSIVVKQNHLPKYSVEGKMAALRVNFGDRKEGQEPYTISPAKAWRITPKGWWLHNEAEWELLRKLEDRGMEVGRPLYPSDKWLGYQPDFVIEKGSKRVFFDVIDPMDEELSDREYRANQFEVYHVAHQAGEITYIQYRLGDQLNKI